MEDEEEEEGDEEDQMARLRTKASSMPRWRPSLSAAWMRSSAQWGRRRDIDSVGGQARVLIECYLSISEFFFFFLPPSLSIEAVLALIYIYNALLYLREGRDRGEVALP